MLFPLIPLVRINKYPINQSKQAQYKTKHFLNDAKYQLLLLRKSPKTLRFNFLSISHNPTLESFLLRDVCPHTPVLANDFNLLVNVVSVYVNDVC